MSKSDQLRALREARFNKPSPFEDAARGRDAAPKSSSEAKGKPQMPAGSKTGDGLARNGSRGGSNTSPDANLSSETITFCGIVFPITGGFPEAALQSCAGIAPGPRETKRARGRPKVQVGGIPPSTGENTLLGWMDIINRQVPSPTEANRRRGRPKVDGKRPWEIEGVSRRTWYRHLKEK